MVRRKKYDIERIRQDFPILKESVNGKRNTFLDSAASSQKPKSVINYMRKVYLKHYSNVHRGLYSLSDKVTTEYENARKTVQHFINASSDKEIIFTKGATEAINLVASTWGLSNLRAGDEVLISEAEHHANLVPWQALRDRCGFTLKFFKIRDDGSYDHSSFLQNLSPRTKLVAVTGMSNVLGTVFPLKKIIKEAHNIGAKVLVDACQYIAHAPVDVCDLDCDFLVFSSHKIYGPSGVGVLYGKYDILETMPPYQFGGDMVSKVSYSSADFAPPPRRFEAGTPAIVETIGMGKAIEYILKIGYNNIMQHEEELSYYAISKLSKVKGLTLVGTSPQKGGIFSFVMKSVCPPDIAMILNKEGVSVRVGHHCAEPLVNRMGYNMVVRASLGVYNTKEDIDILVRALEKVNSFFDL